MFTNSPAGEWQFASHALRAPDTSIQLYLGLAKTAKGQLHKIIFRAQYLLFPQKVFWLL